MNYQERLFRQRWGYGCEPTTALLVTSLVLSAAQGVASIQGQKAQAASQESYQNQLTNANNASAAEQEAQLRQQQAQDAESRAREMQKASQATTRAVSTARTQVAETGQSGGSIDALLSEYKMNQGQYNEAIIRQGQLNKLATNSNIEALKLGTYNQNLSINQPIAQPQYAAAVLNFAGDSVRAFSAWKPEMFKIKSPKTG